MIKCRKLCIYCLVVFCSLMWCHQARGLPHSLSQATLCYISYLVLGTTFRTVLYVMCTTIDDVQNESQQLICTVIQRRLLWRVEAIQEGDDSHWSDGPTINPLPWGPGSAVVGNSDVDYEVWESMSGQKSSSSSRQQNIKHQTAFSLQFLVPIIFQLSTLSLFFVL